MKAIAWFSCGVTSAVACKLALNRYPDAEIVYIEIQSAHADNERFIQECEAWYGKKIQRIRSAKFSDQFDVALKTKYINGPHGARCTSELKKRPRWEYTDQFEEVVQIFGFEFTLKEINRAVRFEEQNKVECYFPLIEQGITKNQAAGMLQTVGIELPAMYKLGYDNNNCIGCLKGGMYYWNRIRKDFPQVFEKAAFVERKVGSSCISGVFLDELDPKAGKKNKEVMGECGLFCNVDFVDVISPKAISLFNQIKDLSVF